MQKTAVCVAARGRLDQLMWTAPSSRHLTRRLAHTVHGGEEYIATRPHARRPTH